MKRVIWMLAALSIFILPVVLYAGQGSTVWYSPWFNDQEDDYGIIDHNTWIQVSNPNSEGSYIRITYYMPSGAAFSNSTSVTRYIPGGYRAAWRPSSDLSLATENLKGSFVIEVVDGAAVMVEEAISTWVAEEEYFDGYVNDDILCTFSVPCQTVSATYLRQSDLMHYDVGEANKALSDGEVVNWVDLCNPNDNVTAVAVLGFYDSTGTPYGNTTTITLAPHASMSVTPSNYGIYDNGAGIAAKGSVVVDVKEGSLVGAYSKLYCTDVGSSGNEFESYYAVGNMLEKQMVSR